MKSTVYGKIEAARNSAFNTISSLTKITFKRGESKMASTIISKNYSIKRTNKSKEITRVLTDDERFWLRVTKTDSCWNWNGVPVDGYGYFRAGGKRWRAHRYSYFLAHGTIPLLDVLHSCDNRLCVNPAHLREGTAKDNAQDKVLRNRQAKLKGEDHGASKLSAESVRQIRRLINEGVKQTVIAEMFHVMPSTITAIKHKRSWGHLI